MYARSSVRFWSINRKFGSVRFINRRFRFGFGLPIKPVRTEPFRALDIRTHPNMCDSLQEARLRLSGPTSFNSVITAEKLAVVRVKRREEASLSVDPVIGEEEAIRLAKEFLIPKNRSN